MDKAKILEKLKIMLSIDKVKQKSLATLIDDTEVFVMDGDIATGSVLYVVTDGEEEVFAPAGTHKTKDGLVITVGENGLISSVETEAPEEPEAAEAPQQESATVELPDASPEVSVATEELLAGIAELISPFIDDLGAVSEELKKMKQKLSEVANEPAAPKIKTKLTNTADLDKMELVNKIRRGLK